MDPEKKSNGALVGLVVIVIILIIGGIYIWMSNKDVIQNTNTPTENITTEDSDQLNSLEVDIQTTDTSTGVDAETVY